MADDSIKLVHINTEDLSWIFFVGQGAYMKARGLEFHAISSSGEYLAKFAASEDVKVYTVEISRAIEPAKDILSIYNLWRRLRLIRPHIVEAHTSKAGILGMIAACMARIPIRIYHNHGMALLSEQGYRRLLLWWCERIACLLAHEVIYVAESVRDAALKQGLCLPDKTRVICSINGLDVAGRFNPEKVGEKARAKTRHKHGIPADALVMGFVGRIFRVKGVTELVAAWDHLSKIFDSLNLLIVGTIDSRVPAPPEVLERLRNDPRIHLTGYVENTPLYYAAMDLLVLPSHHEGLPYALLEASSMQLPVVGTRIPGIMDAIRDGVTGTLVERGDTAALANAIGTYLMNPELRRKHGLAGREFVLRKFSQERVWEALYKEYRRLLSQLDLVRMGEVDQTR
jgi:glycosyltransferase involved in cell wall biosynthesis